jgi:hypothetical protein
MSIPELKDKMVDTLIAIDEGITLGTAHTSKLAKMIGYETMYQMVDECSYPTLNTIVRWKESRPDSFRALMLGAAVIKYLEQIEELENSSLGQAERHADVFSI